MQAGLGLGVPPQTTPKGPRPGTHEVSHLHLPFHGPAPSLGGGQKGLAPHRMRSPPSSEPRPMGESHTGPSASPSLRVVQGPVGTWSRLRHRNSSAKQSCEELAGGHHPSELSHGADDVHQWPHT